MTWIVELEPGRWLSGIVFRWPVQTHDNSKAWRYVSRRSAKRALQYSRKYDRNSYPNAKITEVAE